MPEPSKKSEVRLKDWQGQISNADPQAIPPGAMVEQVNMTVDYGQLTCREGFRACTFDAAATALESSRATFWPPSFAQDQWGNVYIVNGLDRGDRWNGVDATTKNLGLDAPTGAATITPAGGGGATAGDYVYYYRFKAVDGAQTTYSNLSPVTTSTLTANQKGNWSNIDASGDARVTHVELFRSTAGQSVTLYLITTITIGTTTYTGDTQTDAQISAGDFYPIDNADGTENMNRFTPPPDKFAVASFYDRFWYAGDVVYDEGTCEVTNSNAAIVGRGTAWTTRMVNRKIYFAGHTTEYNIDARGSATGITLGATYGGTTNLFQQYAIKADPTERNTIYFSRALEPESVPATEFIRLQEVGDEITGLMPLASYLYALQSRHLWRIYATPGECICFGAQLVSERGCVNNRSWVTIEGTAYLLDVFGIHRFNGDGDENISGPIQDYWNENRINWQARKWFFASIDPKREVIRFHVSLGSAYLPNACLCFDYRAEAWWTEDYAWEFGGVAVANVGGQYQVVYGGEFATFYLQEGTQDGPAQRSIRGTATAATALSITDISSDANIPDSGIVGAPLCLVAGRGKGQTRRIVSSASSVMTVDRPFVVIPDTTTVYQVGGIPWRVKTKVFQTQEDDQTQEQGVEVLTTPTENDASLDLRRYLDQSSAPEDFPATQEANSDSFSTTIKDPDAVAQLKRARSATQTNLGSRSGYAFKRCDYKLSNRQESNRFLQLELRGVQGSGDPVEVHEVRVSGVG